MKNRPIYLFLGTALGLYATPANAEVGCRDMVDKLHKVIKQSAQYQNLTYDGVVGAWPTICGHLSQWGGTYVEDCNENGDTYALVANCGKGVNASTACQNTICGYSGGGDDSCNGGGGGCAQGEYWDEVEESCSPCPGAYIMVDDTEVFLGQRTTPGSGCYSLRNCYIPKYLTAGIENDYGYATLKLGSDCYHNGST